MLFTLFFCGVFRFFREKKHKSSCNVSSQFASKAPTGIYSGNHCWPGLKRSISSSLITFPCSFVCCFYHRRSAERFNYELEFTKIHRDAFVLSVQSLTSSNNGSIKADPQSHTIGSPPCFTVSKLPLFFLLTSFCHLQTNRFSALWLFFLI